MNDLLTYLFKGDPLKAARDLIENSKFVDFNVDERNPDGAPPISVSLLFLASIFLTLTKVLHDDAGLTFAQHFIASLVMIFIGYIVSGLVMTMARMDYARINNFLRCFFACFMASLIVSLSLVYVDERIWDAGIAIIEIFTKSDNLTRILVQPLLSACFSFLGCFAIFWLKRDRNGYETPQNRRRQLRLIYRLTVYWLLTSFILNFMAFDREWFFDTVVKQIAKIKFV